MTISFNIAEAENGQKFVTVFANGTLTAPVDDTHPNFTKIVGACAASAQGDDSIGAADVLALFDIPSQIIAKFERLSERVTVENGTVCFDGDPAQPGISTQILRFMDDDEDFEPLVGFMEKMSANPNDHSRQQAWDWLNQHDFTLTPWGDVIAYKGVYSDNEGGYRSGSRGHAFVNDIEVKNDYVSNSVGDVVTMPRSEVAHDPQQACHAGLHVGTYDYAMSYARGAMLRVLIDPRDIVSVPTDAAGEKIRVCRYKVEAIIDAPDTACVYETHDFVDDDNRDLRDERGRFHRGRPGSERDSAGRFVVAGGPSLAGFHVGDRVEDYEGDLGTVVQIDCAEDRVIVEYDSEELGRVDFTESEMWHQIVSSAPQASAGFRVGDRVEDEDGDPGTITERQANGSFTVEFDNEDFGEHTYTAAKMIQIFQTI